MKIHPLQSARQPQWLPVSETLDVEGIVYVATGKRFLEEARSSAKHLRRHHPHLPVCLVSDCAGNDPAPFWNDLVPVHDPVFGFRDKILMGLCPYRRFLFLDTDIRVFAPLDDVFALLRRFDFVGHQLFEGHDCPVPGIPDAFAEFNAGVLGFTRTSRLDGFFARWQELFDQYFSLNSGGNYHYSNASDQKSLRRTVWESGASVGILGPEFNFIPHHLNFACANVRILHGRGDENLQQLEQRLNTRLGNRVYIPRLDVVISDDPLPRELFRLWVMSGLQLLRLIGRALTPLALRDLLRRSRLINRLFMRNRFTESTPNDTAKWKQPQ